MNKIAVCLFGLVGGTIGKEGSGKILDLNYARKGFKMAFEKKYIVDYYIHTWSFEHEKEISQAYEPLKIITEPKIKFEPSVWEKKIKNRMGLYQYIRLFFKKLDLNQEAQNAYRSMSRWVSTKKSFDLIPASKVNEYDFIISSRLDLEFFNEFVFPENLSNSQLLLAHWNRAPIKGVRDFADYHNFTLNQNGFSDLWFAGKPEVMRNFTSLFDRFESYSYNPHLSSQEHANYLGLSTVFKYFRYFDFELVRRYRYKSEK